MDHVEKKLAALKKAYVDVILNTAKESAVRVLAAESKAERFQQNRKDAKDEALNTLLRVKGIMDAKMKEANTVSLGQTRRIHDLESQLYKAKQTIACLMTELKRVSNEMEKMKSSISGKEEAEINDQGSEMKDQGTCFEDTLEETKSISNSLQCRAIDRHNDKPTADGLKKSISSTSQASGEPCHVTSNTSFHINSLRERPQRNNFSSCPDLASLIMSSKEPELYRNRCTQRICALEQKDMLGKVLQGKDERQFKNVYVDCTDELLVSLVDSCMGTNIVAQSMEPNIMLTENVVRESEIPYTFNYSSRKLKRRERSTNKIAAGNECSRISRNDDVAPKNSRNALSTQSMEKCNMMLLRCVNTSLGHLLVKDELPIPDTKAGFCGETLSEIDRNEGLPDISNMKNIITTANGVQSGEGPTITDDTDGLHCKVKMETADAPIDNDEANDNSSGFKSSLTKATSERHLKYTFQRKRIRGTSANTSEDILPEKQITLKRKTGDIVSPPSSPPPCEKSSMAKELPRESRRIAQVARQLISLSEKRW